jgi:hypothetical protein
MSICFLRIWASRPCFALVVALTAALTTQRVAFAQPLPDGAQPTPRLLTVMPPGGKVGTVVEVTFSGADLDEPENLLFSHAGIKAEAIIPPDPPKPPDGKPPPPKTPVTKFKVTIPAETPVGIYDVRLVNKWGVSNPRAFVVGDLNEVLEKEPNNDVPEAQRVDLNTTISGTIAAPTDVDYFVFAAKKGQRVIVSCLASSIDSRLRPGIEVYNAKGKLVASNRNYYRQDALCDLTVADDGDYHVRLFEFTHTQGNAEHFYRLSITTGPWIDAVHPCAVEPGKATQVTVYGRNLPGGKPDPALSSDDVPLEKVTVTVNAPAEASRLRYNGFLPPQASQLDGFEYRIKNDSGWSNPFLLTFARSPLVIANDATKSPDAPQAITVPCEIAGHINKERDRDWYQFTAKKGEVYNIELLSDRLGAPAYMYFMLRNADTKQDIVESADNPDLLNLKFFARSEDPQIYKFTVPADGKYLLMVSSRTADRIFGPRQFYRVRISPDQPDFQLIVMPQANTRPDAAVLGQGGNQKFDVLAWRRDGFVGDITLSVEGLPPGVTCAPQTIGGNLRLSALVLTASADAARTDPAPPRDVGIFVGTGLAANTGHANWTGEIKVKGTAMIRGQKVEREARSGTILWPVQPQQNIAPLSRLDRQIVLAVRDKPAFTLTATIDKPSVPQGTPAQITIKVARNSADLKNPLAVQATVAELPPGFTINNNQPLNIAPDKNEATVPVTVPANVPPGTYTIVLRGTVPIPFNKDPKGPKQPVIFVEYSSPVTLTVVPKSVATIALPNPTLTAKVGVQSEYVVKLTRQFDYDGEFKVEVVIPAAVKDVTVAAVTVPAGKDEAKLLFNIPADAPPGNRADLVVKATAMYQGTPIVHEAKFNVNVVK